MNRSEDIKELVTALSKAQGVMKPAVFDKVNPHFKSKYASFTSCVEACQKPLADNGLSFMQYCEIIGDKYQLVTMIAHISGQWIKSYFPFNPLDNKIQTLGSTLSYAKRYSLCAMLGIVSDDDDDDGNTADKPKPKEEPIIYISNEQINHLINLERKLNDTNKKLVKDWIASSYKSNSFADILEKNFSKIVLCYENAIKKQEEEKKNENY
jgi:hypothetical protein